MWPSKVSFPLRGLFGGGPFRGRGDGTKGPRPNLHPSLSPPQVPNMESSPKKNWHRKKQRRQRKIAYFVGVKGPQEIVVSPKRPSQRPQSPQGLITPPSPTTGKRSPMTGGVVRLQNIAYDRGGGSLDKPI